MPEDSVLLQQYAENRDAAAFAELVNRHTRLVYGTCLRVTANAHDAEDVTQQCFLELAKRSDAVTSSVAGWLHAMALNRSKNSIRGSVTRRKHEGEAVTQHAPRGKESTWEEVSPLVDEALVELPDDLRLPLMLHYLEGKTQSDVATELDLNQSTVSRRLESGVGELRSKLKKSGVIVSVAILASMLTTNTSVAAPAGLVAALGKMALAGIGDGAASATTGGLLGSVAGKIALAAAVAGTVVGGVAVHKKTSAPEPVPLAPVVAPTELPAETEEVFQEGRQVQEDAKMEKEHAEKVLKPIRKKLSKAADAMEKAVGAVVTTRFSDSELMRLTQWKNIGYGRPEAFGKLAVDYAGAFDLLTEELAFGRLSEEAREIRDAMSRLEAVEVNYPAQVGAILDSIATGKLTTPLSRVPSPKGWTKWQRDTAVILQQWHQETSVQDCIQALTVPADQIVTIYEWLGPVDEAKKEAVAGIIKKMEGKECGSAFFEWEKMEQPETIAQKLAHNITMLDSQLWHLKHDLAIALASIGQKRVLAPWHTPGSPLDWGAASPENIERLTILKQTLEQFLKSEGPSPETKEILNRLGTRDAYREKAWLAGCLDIYVQEHLRQELPP